MRFINAAICLLLVVFALLQYNDPDFYLWIPVYAMPALWAGLAAYRPRRLQRPAASLLLGATLAISSLGSWWFWPGDEAFWHEEVWRHSESAREGMGMMIVTLSLVLVVITVLTSRPGPPGDAGN